jgi:uncharacterized OsmC-like protein
VIYASSGVMLIGVILIVLSAFGVAFGPVDIFKLGTACCFVASGVAIFPKRAV